MRGIILAGDNGNDYQPATRGTNKHLLPLFDKPLLYYPLSTLIEAGCREVLIFCKAIDLPHFRRTLGDGSHLGMWLTYRVEPGNGSLAQALVSASDFTGGEPVAVISADQVFLGEAFVAQLRKARHRKFGATMFTAEGPHAAFFAALTRDGRPVRVMHEASEAVQTVTNFFLFHSGYLEIAQAILASPTPQNHLVDLHERYLARKQLFNVCLDQRATWLSPRTADEFLESALLLRTLIGQNGLRAGYVEAAAYRAGYLEDAAFCALAKRAGNSPYGDYLREIATPNQFAA